MSEMRGIIGGILSGLATGYGLLTFIDVGMKIGNLTRTTSSETYDFHRLIAEAAVTGLRLMQVIARALLLIAAQLIRTNATPAPSGE